MTKRYTADDFANAKFAEHPQGGVAAKNGPEDSPWSIAEGCWEDDHGMLADGWVPVPTKPTITESQYKLALDEDRDPQYVYGFTAAMRLLGGEVIPDPKPTNTDKLTRLINSAQLAGMDARNIAEYLEGHGIRVKGN